MPTRSDRSGNYLGTVVSDRLHRISRPYRGYPGYPGYAGYPGYGGIAGYRSPPTGFRDVDEKLLEAA